MATVAEKARLLEDIGYDGLVCEETKDDPFIVLALAAQATTRLHLTTGVAIAFPRSPTVTAMTARQISDDVLEQYAVIDTYDRIGQRLRDRFQGVVTDIEFSIAVNNDRDRDILKGLAKTIQVA